MFHRSARCSWPGPARRASSAGARVAPSANAREHERYTQALARVRERGYAVGFGRPRPRSVDGADLLRDFEEYVLVEMEAAQHFPIMNLAAPIIDPEGNVPLAISLVGFYEQMQAADIPRLGRRLRAATAAVSRATWGTSDPPAPPSGPRPETAATRGAPRPRPSGAATSDLERLRAQRTH
ncbi:hypothetical protein MXD62_26230 [Frankia sp. Mgl5]|uniref:hypothetical protein n=1 Tax=Frankia sp. Mgl5 TaxID=2933793 RepID=UPI00200ED8A4|nr:hypothetical protein [Frankia sp. Mgl5]MCK9930620.1 hypothetical protein [Frankia sp. Mgl5]